MAGIVGYGAYIPFYRIKAEEIAKTWGKEAGAVKKGLAMEEKSVAAADEDTVTMSVEASLNALKRAGIDRKKIGAVYSGSESKVYAVKPNATIIGEMLDIGNNYTAADLEFACKAGTAGLQAALAMVKAGMIEYGLAIGADTAQAKPGDILEYTASSGAAAFIVGNKKEEIIAEFEGTASVSSDTPDFWRRNLQPYPEHGERFTGEPAYFRHVVGTTKALMEQLKLKVEDIDHMVFHTPNGKFPMKAGKMLGFPEKKTAANLLVSEIGNTYSGASLLVLTHVLDNAKPGERIVVTSFGSGAGSDAFSFKVTANITRKQKNAPATRLYADRKRYVDYASYAKMRGVF